MGFYWQGLECSGGQFIWSDWATLKQHQIITALCKVWNILKLLLDECSCIKWKPKHWKLVTTLMEITNQNYQNIKIFQNRTTDIPTYLDYRRYIQDF